MSLIDRLRPFAVAVTWRFAMLALLASPFASPQVLAQPAPLPALRIVVPVSAGGTSDSMARLLAGRIARALDRAVIVENRPGGTGRVAMDAFRSAAPANVLLVAPIVLPVITPIVDPKLSYGPRDLAPVTQIGTFDYAIAVAADSDAPTFADFVQWAHAHPASVNVGGVGTASIPHLTALLIARDAELAATYVPYAEAGKLDADLAGGHLAGAVAATSDFMPLYRAGRIRILATTARTRSPLLPDVPTLRELGYPALEFTGWNAVFASPQLPAEQIDAVSRAVRNALREPAMQQKLRDAGLAPTGTTSQELADIIARDIAFWTPVIRTSGFVPEAR